MLRVDLNADQATVRTSEVFRGLTRLGEGETIPLGALTQALGDRAFGLLVLIFALPNIIPMIPGVSTISGVVIAIVGLQMLIGRHDPWLPAFIADRGLPRAETAKMIERAIPWVEKLESLARPRALFMTRGVMRMLIGAMFVMLGVVLALPLSWIGNFPPGVALLIMSVGFLEEDGLLVGAAHILGLLATLLVVVIVGGVIAGAAWLIG
ncbi:exopolysaccharide biosynthesis protein [Phreatobacter stygius]|uniref:Exopolysaccharide biosynthesis protein n=1 Tax=Phreatobacter stygius TaxID=1940610 RepID=A0A4D7APD1_9HYPH|nr:exopolysaccharide biosynthesis protein [Phreatobacter stygius]